MIAERFPAATAAAAAMRLNTLTAISQVGSESRTLLAQSGRFARPLGLDEDVVALIVADAGDC